MRITHRMITARYTRNLNAISYELDKLNTKVVTGRKFMTASENPAAAVSAFKIRRDLSRVEDFQANIQHAKSSLSNAESTLMHVQEMMKEITGKTLSAITGTMEEGGREIVAEELRQLQNQLLASLNGNASDIYYFGGSNVNEKPFTLDASGKLMYNGVLLDSLNYTTSEALRTDSQYVDIGLGVQFDASDNIDRRSVFQYSVPGINVVGYGQSTITYGGTTETVSNNLYDILGELIAEFESPTYDRARADALYGHLKENSSNVLTCITDIGARTSYLDFMNDRYDSSVLDLKERQMNVEAADPAETIILFESQKVAYNAALRMGAQIIQPSIFNFMG